MGLSQLEICNQALLKVGADTIDTLTEPTSTEDGTKRSIKLCNIFFGQAYEEVLRMYPWNSAKKRTTVQLSEITNYPTTVTLSGAGEVSWNDTFLYVDEYNGKSRYSLTGGTTATRIIKFSGTKWEMTDPTANEDYANTTFDESDINPPKTGWVTQAGTAPAPELAFELLFGYDRSGILPTDIIRLVDIFRYANQSDERTAWVVEGGYILSDYDMLYLKYISKPSDTTKLDPLCTNALICNLAMKLCTPLQLDDAWAKRINDELYGIILPAARSIDTMENKELLVEESSWLLSREYEYPVI